MCAGATAANLPSPDETIGSVLASETVSYTTQSNNVLKETAGVEKKILDNVEIWEIKDKNGSTKSYSTQNIQEEVKARNYNKLFDPSALQLSFSATTNIVILPEKELTDLNEDKKSGPVKLEKADILIEVDNCDLSNFEQSVYLTNQAKRKSS
uniref:Uncharacterized protein n=1 Tax=Ditylenchus dipsaci TaxID=166011 RepID=A0A915D695_9BILA